MIENIENILEEESLCRPFENKLSESCTICGEGISRADLEVCLIGNDVVALFPSIKSENTGKIVRKELRKVH